MKSQTEPLNQINLGADQTRYVSPIHQVWHLTYAGQLCQVWHSSQTQDRRDYARVTWQQEGSARRAAGLMNQRFRTLAFGYVRMVPQTTVPHSEQ